MVRNIFSNLSKFKSNVALINSDLKPITYKELLNDVKKFSKYFKTKKLIVILAENYYEFFVCYVSSIKYNQTLLILNPKAKEEDTLNLFRKYLPDYIFCKKSNNYSGYFTKFNFMNYKLMQIKKNKKYHINKEISCLLSTSGSTGDKKFVKISRENLLNNTHSISKFLKIKSSDIAITTMPPYYSYALSIINTHLVKGAKIIINNLSFIDRNFWKLFDRYKPNNLNGVPYNYEILDKIRFENINLSSLRYFTQAGGKMEKNLRNKLIKYCYKKKIEFFVMYGQAEASPRISIMPWKLLKKFPDSVGYALPGGKVTIDKEGNSKKKEGEIIFKGKNVFWGYSSSYRDLEDENKINFLLRTGDVGFIDKKKLIYITGRKKRILKIFGIRLSLDQLENELKKNNYQCVCSGSDKKLNIYILDNKKLNIEYLNKKIIHLTNLSKKFFDIIKVKTLKRNEIGKIIYNF